MIRVYVRKKNEAIGHVFKSHFSPMKDTIKILPFTFVISGIINENDWNNSQEQIKDKLDLYITERKIDGRCKLAKSMKTFSWHEVLMPKNKKV